MPLERCSTSKHNIPKILNIKKVVKMSAMIKFFLVKSCIQQRIYVYVSSCLSLCFLLITSYFRCRCWSSPTNTVTLILLLCVCVSVYPIVFVCLYVHVCLRACVSVYLCACLSICIRGSASCCFNTCVWYVHTTDDPCKSNPCPNGTKYCRRNFSDDSGRWCYNANWVVIW